MNEISEKSKKCHHFTHSFPTSHMLINGPKRSSNLSYLEKSNHDFCVGREDTSLALEHIAGATSPKPERVCCSSEDPVREEGLAQG